MHASLCVCALIPRIETRTRVVLVIHRAEDRKPTNTGRLATECLANSEVVVRGHEGKPDPPLSFARPVLLFPHEDAIPIAAFARDLDEPVALVVPDGNWRQASKVRARVAGMRDAPCVALPAAEPSIYRLRSEAHPFGLATLEAIARALRVLEGDRGAEIERALLFPFRAMVERTLWSRGDVETGEVTGGIPEGAQRHDPRSGAVAR
ncbi:MAG: DTW domain-containing protein [Labilithrix sp.]|nr:DTW domain-containing protein [Labilithrix sp.]